MSPFVFEIAIYLTDKRHGNLAITIPCQCLHLSINLIYYSLPSGWHINMTMHLWLFSCITNLVSNLLFDWHINIANGQIIHP